MKMNKLTLTAVSVTAAAVCIGLTLPAATHAATPVVAQDDGAFVRLVGNPADGTAKFQFGWRDETAASEAAGYWVGLYDVTNSHYEWSFDTGAVALPDEIFRNARPTSYLPNGEYKVVFFVRGTYGPATNISEIELPFTVKSSVS